jgi:hypothetical protein
VTTADGKADGILIYIWNHKTLRHYRLEKEMRLRRKQREEQATEIQITTIETQQQQKCKNKDDKKRKEIMKPNHTTEWIQERLALITQLDGTGGHEPPSKMVYNRPPHSKTTTRTERAKSRQQARCNCHANPRGTHRNDVYYYQGIILIQDLAGQVQ